MNHLSTNNINNINNFNKSTIKGAMSSLNGYFSSELLAPAGSVESFYTAINAGADAIYMGGDKFGARAFADNPNTDQLLQLIDYCHIHQKQLYLTVNTLLKDSEIEEELYEYLLPFYREGLDAVIVQDYGVMTFIGKHFPQLPIHCSTQMTIGNKYYGQLIKNEKNITRLVMPRELSLTEIKNIYDNTGLEIEAFVHGALCYCYSGQCLFSSVAAGRSGNRGRCGQPCRLPYKLKGDSSYLLSPKDLMSLEQLPDILKAGVYSLKIEGRMKKPEYVASVISTYRHYIDLLNEKGIEAYKVKEADVLKLMDIYNRGNFTKGYFYNHNGKDMITLSKPNHTGVKALKRTNNNNLYTALIDINNGDVLELDDQSIAVTATLKKGKSIDINRLLKLKKTYKQLPEYIYRTRNNQLIEELHKKYVDNNKKLDISCYIYVKKDEPIYATLTFQDITVSKAGEVVSKASSRPVQREDLIKQFVKTGNTPFVLKEENIFIELDKDCFVGLGNLNQLRRQLIEELIEDIISVYKRDTTEKDVHSSDTLLVPDMSANIEQLNESKDLLVSSRDHFDNSKTYQKQLINCLVSSLSHIESIIDHPIKEYVSIIYADWDYLDEAALRSMSGICKENNKKLYLALPYVFRIDAEKRLYDFLSKNSSLFSGYLVRSLDEYGFLINNKFIEPDDKNTYPIVFDYNIYGYNSYSKAYLNSLKPAYITAPMELDYEELKELGINEQELILYGNIPLMISAQCINKTIGGCLRAANPLDTINTITDRMGNRFNTVSICKHCMSIIYNNKPLSLINNLKKAAKLSPASYRLMFTLENANQCKSRLTDFYNIFVLKKDISDIDFDSNQYTKVHFARKIQ